MPATRLPPGPLNAAQGLAELERIYRETETRIQTLIRRAASRGSRGTATYYRMQLLQVQAQLARLHGQAAPLARATVRQAYLSATTAVDLHASETLPTFTGINESAINQLAYALAAPLQRISMTVGRQANDAFRQAGLTESGIGLASGRTRRQTSAAIIDSLARQGVTGFVDRRGRGWSMSTYASMVARTTTREAVTQGTIDRMQQSGLDLVTWTASDAPCPECAAYADQTFSLSGDTPGYDDLPDEPPLHPNCECVLTPAAADLESFIGSLGGDEPTVPDTASLDAEQQMADEALGSSTASIPAVPDALAGDLPPIKAGGNLTGRIRTPDQLEALFHPADPQRALADAGLGEHALPKRIPRAQALIQTLTRKSLREDRNLPDQVTVYADHPAGTIGPVHVNLNPFHGASEMTIGRDQVLADTGRILPRTSNRDDLLVNATDLKPAGTTPPPPPPVSPAVGTADARSELLKGFANSDALVKTLYQPEGLDQMRWLPHLKNATEQDLARLRQEVYDRTQTDLASRGAPEEMTLYRNPDFDTRGGLEKLESEPTHNALGSWDQPVLVRRSDVLVAPRANLTNETRYDTMWARPEKVRPMPEPAGEAREVTAPAETFAGQMQRTIAKVAEAPSLITHAEVRQIGERIAGEVERRAAGTIERQRQELQARIDEQERTKREAFDTTNISPFWDDPEYKAADEQLRKLNWEQRGLGLKAGKARAAALQEILGEIRPMGGQVFGAPTRSAAQRAIYGRLNAEAAPYLPSRWLERARANGRLDVEPQRGRSRAFYRHAGSGDTLGTITISKDAGTSTYLHEASHPMEYIIPQLMRLENDYLRSRTAGNPLRRLKDIAGGSYREDEVAYQAAAGPGATGWTDPYMGKVYERRPPSSFAEDGRVKSTGASRQTAGEIFTMGQEGVWYGKYRLFERDRDYYNFIVGLLATL